MKKKHRSLIFFLLLIVSCAQNPVKSKSLAKKKNHQVQSLSYKMSAQEHQNLIQENSNDEQNVDQIIYNHAHKVSEGQIANGLDELEVDERLTIEKDAEEEKLAELLEKENEIKKLSGGKNQNGKQFLQMRITDRVKYWVEYFTNKDRERFQRFINNGQKYRDIIEQTLQKYNLPSSLFFVGLIESGYYLQAASHASAVGPWQFIRATGKRYGLTISKNLDERSDIYKASNAASLYFKDLFNIFGSWELALSAYNAGEFGIINRIRKANTRDYFELSEKGFLPKETADYVPKVVASMIIYQNAQQYGFTIPKVDNPFANTSTIEVKHSVSLNVLDAKFGLPQGTLVSLNPEIRRNITPYYQDKFYHLRIPNTVLSTHSVVINDLKSMRSRKGFRQSYSIDENKLAEHSNRKNRKSKFQSKDAVSTMSSSLYLVRKGDNLFSIAKAFNIPMNKLQRFNSLKSKNVQIGQKLKIPSNKKQIYVVKRGDNIDKIAQAFGKSPREIMSFNDLNSPRIYPGQTLVIHVN